MSSGFPNLAAPLVNPQTGQVTPPWLRLLAALFERTGGAPGIDFATQTQLAAVATTADAAATSAAAAQATAADALTTAYAADAPDPAADPLLALLFQD